MHEKVKKVDLVAQMALDNRRQRQEIERQGKEMATLRRLLASACKERDHLSSEVIRLCEENENHLRAHLATVDLLRSYKSRLGRQDDRPRCRPSCCEEPCEEPCDDSDGEFGATPCGPEDCCGPEECKTTTDNCKT